MINGSWIPGRPLVSTNMAQAIKSVCQIFITATHSRGAL